jgi:hypothetical protein
MLADALFELPENLPTRRKRRRKGERLYPEKKYKKRVNRNFERGPLAVANAIPRGSSRPAYAEYWVKHVMQHDDYLSANAQCRRNIITFVRVIARSVDHTSMTVSPGWEYLIRETGLSRSTINRIRARLHKAGLLGTVAKGRQAQYTPQKDINERAIYVLLVPSQLKSVEKSEPATGDYEVIAPQARAYASVPQSIKDVATPRQTFEASPSGSPRVAATAPRPQERWHGSRTTKSAGAKGACRESELQAATELQLRFFALRRTTTADVATRCRPFFRKGWTINDIARALDTKPDGSKWPHDGATGILDVGRWMQYRLQAWMIDGRPMMSRTQRELVRARELKAKRRVEVERQGIEQQRRQQAQLRTTSEWKAVCKAVARGDAKINDETGEVIWNAGRVRD